ncbi:ComEC/Rec2 family competence protein [Paraburkholderia sp. SIMBA_027]|uniref:ComEC/Rec2 family competence protein n=1 Tax=Paraburkholderia sp. SIMBA_027 TaxID=3085770 RepID=UPI00397B9826
MAKVHIINVSPGDCTIIEHNSGRLTGIDICGGNLEVRQKAAAVEARATGLLGLLAMENGQSNGNGNFRMCERPSNPINYIQTYGLGRFFRFIVTHPDMDHMDGLAKLHTEIGFDNFWDTGARREAPDFDGFYRYSKDDWDMYQRLIANRVDGVTVLKKIAGDYFPYASKPDKDGKAADALYILAPDKELLCDPNENDDINEASYVLNYNSLGGNMVFPGDAHDASWEYVIENNKYLQGNCSFLLAPHHGRHSERSYDFLDFLKPKLTVLGCSPSKYIDYGQWSRRGLEILTSNQAGNIVLDINDGYYDVYVENDDFVNAKNGSALGSMFLRNEQGFRFYKRISK